MAKVAWKKGMTRGAWKKAMAKVAWKKAMAREAWKKAMEKPLLTQGQDQQELCGMEGLVQGQQSRKSKISQS